MKRRRNSYGKYELAYGSGGHGGPYRDMRQAYKRGVALLKGRRAERSLEIVNRSSGQPVVVLTKDYATGEIHGARVRGYGMSRNPRRYRRNRLSGPFSKKGRAAARRYKRSYRKARLTLLRRAKAGGWGGYGKIKKRLGQGRFQYVRPPAWMKENPSSGASNQRHWKETLKALDAAYWAVTKKASPKAQKAAMSRLAKKAKKYGIHVPLSR